MAGLTLKKAQRSKAYLKLGMSAPSGGGKTLGALLIAYGLMKEKYPVDSEEARWGKIAIIDSENGSGELYVGKDIGNVKIGDYNAITLTPPFTADKYTEAIGLCKDNNIEVCIIDSTTHLWAGQGGLLEQQGNAAKRSGNSYTAWRDVTPQHNQFIDTMLQTPMHVIATMRSKQEHVQEKDPVSGKTTVRKIGLNPVQRDGMEYEFTMFLEIDAEHQAFGSKDRTSLFDQQTFKITPAVGVTLMKWLDGGVETAPTIVAVASHPADPELALKNIKAEIIQMCKALGGQGNAVLMEILKSYEPTNSNPNKITDEGKLVELRAALTELSETKN